jgi:uncharacterized Zn finger protein
MVREGGVALDEGAESGVLARVRDGPSLFVVHLTALRRELQVACTCPVFALGRDACRHVWAALVATDRVRRLARLRPVRDFELVRAAPTIWSGGS